MRPAGGRGSDPATPPRTVRTAIVGCGGIAHEHLGALAGLDGVDVVAVADRSEAASSFVARRYDAGQAFGDLATMLEAVEPEVVHVLTPPSSHVPLVEQCLDAGAHVVCEKPLAPTAAEAGSLVDHARRADRMLIESQNLRFNDQVRRIDRDIDAGRLGAVRCVDVTLSLDLTAGPFGDENLGGGGLGLRGGAVHDFLPHLVYLFEHFADHDASGIERAAGTIANRSGNPRVGFDSLDVVVETGDRRGLLRVASDISPDSFRLIVRGDERSVETDFYNPFARIEGGANVGKRAPFEQMTSGLKLAASGFTGLRDKVAQHGPMHGLVHLLDAFYVAVRDGGPSPISAAEIVATARSIDCVLDSVRSFTLASS